MKLFEEFKLWESMWDDTSCKEAVVVDKDTDQLCSVLFDGKQMFTGTKEECEDWVKSKGSKFANRLTIKDSATINTVKSEAKTSAKQARKAISEDVTAEYDDAEVKACLNRVNSAANTEPSFDYKYGEGMIFVSVSEEQLKKALRIGNRGTFQDGAAQATTMPAQAVDDMVICFNFYEEDRTATVSLMLGGDDDTYYDDICVVGWGDHIAGLSNITDMQAAKTFFETQLVPNANKIAEDIINDSWAHYQLPDYAGITTRTAAVTESTTSTSWDSLVAQADSFLDAIVKATGNERYDDGDGYWEAEGITWCNRYLYYGNSLNNTKLIKDLCDVGSSKIPNSNFYYTEDDMEDEPVSEIGYTLTKAPVTESGCKGAECKKKDLKENSSLTSYRVVLADYDTDDFDINVEFGMQDPDENEVLDYEYLLKPGQTKGDLVVWLSRDCGYTSIYVHDERPATDADIKRLASDTCPVTDTGDEWQGYGNID